MRCAVLEEGVPSTKKMAALSRGSTPPSRLSFPRALVFPPGDIVRLRAQVAQSTDEGRLVVPHADDDGAIEGRIGVSVPAPIEAVPAGGDPRRSGDGTRAPEFRKGGFRANPVGVIAEEAARHRAIAATDSRLRSSATRSGCITGFLSAFAMRIEHVEVAKESPYAALSQR